jgi:uncharacterized Zn-binding protein involved in type VI secretion
MAKLLVVKNDPVAGTDTHNVSGLDTTVPNPLPYTGTGDYAYNGQVSGALSDFVSVDGIALAIVTSSSTLTEAGAADHLELAGKNYQPPAPAPNPATLSFVPPTGVGDGKPAAGVGSALLTVNGTKALLDGDTFDTCGIPGGQGKATVAATGQTWVISA